MNHSKKSILLCIITLFITAFLVGWKVKPVELLDNKLLIDLDSTIQEASWGKEGNTDNNSIEEIPDITEEEPADIEIPDAAEATNNEKIRLHVSIQGEKIILDGNEMKDIKTLESQLSQRCTENVILYLEDNYAESHIYKDASQIIEQLKATNSFEFIESVG